MRLIALLNSNIESPAMKKMILSGFHLKVYSLLLPSARKLDFRSGGIHTDVSGDVNLCVRDPLVSAPTNLKLCPLGAGSVIGCAKVLEELREAGIFLFTSEFGSIDSGTGLP